MVCSVIFALYIWTNFGQIEVGNYNKEINPVGIVAGISLIVSAIIIQAIMQSIAHILRNSIAIRNNIEEDLKDGINQKLFDETLPPL